MSRFGRYFLIGLRPTLDLHPDDRKLLSTVRPAGIIVFRKNFEHGAPYEQWHARFSKLIAEACEAIGRERILICIDHEGGTILRPPLPVTPFAFARSWADRASAVGRAMGMELASLGINVNFAPVVDIDSNPANPVIGPRAFASDAAAVEACAREFIDGMQGQGVLACLKHFPGHGDTTTDSHYSLPTLNVDLPALRARELQPFAALVRNDISLVMTAHIRFPQIDPVHPATMSHRLVKELLRDELGYEGVIVTDDIGMKAVSDMFEHPGACAQALSAGSDLIIICSHWTNTDRVYGMTADMERSAQAGELSEQTLDDADARISKLVERATVNTPRLLGSETFSQHVAIAPLQQRAGAEGQTVSLRSG